MISNEESVNELTQIASQGGRGAFFFLRWFHGYMGRKKQMAPQKEVDRLMTDACSRYRGGYYHPENEALTSDLLSQMSQGKATGTQPFFFLGNRSDLSVFWQVTKPEQRTLTKTVPDQRVVVPRAMIEQIPDETVRKRTFAAFAKAQADGLVRFDGRSYFITETGKHYIVKSDFVLSRLEAEYKFFTSAETTLEKEAANQKRAEKEEWIDARLREKGIDPEQYEGCRRVTIDRASLEVEQQGQDWMSNVPGTARRQKVILPGDHVVDVDEKILIAFIDPGKVYPGSGTKSRITGAELMEKFDDKTENLTRHPSTEAIRKAAAPTSGVEAGVASGGSSFDRDEFFEAALRDSMRRHGKLPDTVAKPKLQVGDTVYAPDHFRNSLTLHEYKIASVLEDGGQNWYKLTGADVPDQLLPESAFDKLMFTDAAHGEAYLTAHSKEAADYADELLAHTMGESFSAQSQEVTVHTLTVDKSCLISNTGESCRVQLPGKQVEQVVLPSKDVVQAGEHLEVSLYGDQTYKIITGAYSYTVTGDGLAKMSGAPVQTAAKASVGAASQAVGNTAASATAISATATATAATQTATHAAVAAIPVPEPITMSAKAIYAAAAQATTTVVQTTVQAVGETSLKLTQSIGKEN